jgi:pimeloyl-ACP methyl ester carboxylesterase
MQAALRVGFRALSALAPGLAARLATRLWFRIPKPKIGDGAREFLATGEHFAVAVNGRRVAAWRWGTGPAVILMHGWGGYGAQFQTVIEAIARGGMQAVTFDAPSHGASEPGALGARYSTLFEFADALREVARVVPDLAGVVAHSGGSTATAWMLNKHPDVRVPRLVFVAPFARALRYMTLFQRVLGLSDEALRRFRATTEAQFNFRWEELEVPEMADRMRTPPLLVIHDREDRETSWQDGADIAAKWPSAELITTTGLGHNRILRDPGVVQSIVGFLVLARRQ